MVFKRGLSIFMACFIALAFIPGLAFADTAVTEWVARFDGPGAAYDEARDIEVDAAGNIYITGVTQGSGDYHFVTVKYDAGGTLLWSAVYDGAGTGFQSAEAVAVDAAGNVFVVGTVINANRDQLVIKYDAEGVEQWAVSRNGPADGDDYGICLALDEAGNVYVGGSIDINGWNNSDMLVTCLDTAGNNLWEATYDGPVSGTEGASSIVLDGNGSLYASGTSSGTNNFDYAVVKFDTAGNQLWAGRYDGPAMGADYCNGMVLDGAGNVVLVGRSDSGGSNWDYLTVALAEADGAFQWEARYDAIGSEDQGSAIVSDGAGRVCVTGTSVGAGGSYDIATVMYGAGGTQLWAVRHDGPANGDDWGEKLAMDDGGNVYVVGETETASGHSDFTTIKYDAAGNEEWVEFYNESGTGYDGAFEIAVDAQRNVFSTGTTSVSGNYDITTIKYGQVAPSTVACSLTCLPDSGFVPFSTTISTDLVNNHHNPRLLAARVDLTLANGTFFSNYRRGTTAVPGYGTRHASWSQLLNSGVVIGDNTVLLAVEDVTPAPYNQPPAPPSGDTATGTCTVTAEARR